MRCSKITCAGLLGLLACATSPASGLPSSSFSQEINAGPELENDLVTRADPGNFYLRIMPLGASITVGTDFAPEGDQGKNGYRKYLRDKLREDGWNVSMVGDQSSGNMADSDHEGISGQLVDQVATRGRGSAKTWLPNVVLVNAGTNDANEKQDEVRGGRTGLKMRELIQGIFAEVPQAVVVLSTLLPKRDNAEFVEMINNQYRQIYRQFVPLDSNGNEVSNPAFKVVLADMQPFMTMEDILPDGTHPTDLGNRKMAAVWHWAINVAHDRGWIQAPKESGLFGDDEGTTTCRKQFGSGASDPKSGRQVLFANSGEIRDDGTYKHEMARRGDRDGRFQQVPHAEPDRVMGEQSNLWFAQLVNLQNSPKGDERDELILALSDRPDRKLVMYLNNGVGEFIDSFPLDPQLQCGNDHIRWGDVNADGLDDFICVQENGEIYVSINKGGSPPTFENIGLYKTQEMGLRRDRVRLGDMDGDGRLDYCLISDAGNVHCWRNGGIGDRAAYWQDMGQGSQIFDQKGKGDIRGVQLVDINGDGRYDWLWMSREGEVDTYINQREDGAGMRPFWNPAGITHGGMGENIGDNREFIKWGRILSGRPSYIRWRRESCLGEGTRLFCRVVWQTYENRGSGGTYQKGDGIAWGDTTGSGFDDYVWISQDGEVNVFRNKNTKEDNNYYETTAWLEPTKLVTGLPRRSLHLGDWDGDGKADVIGVTDLKTGHLKVWYSRWNGNAHNWEEEDIPDPGREWCTQGFGRLPFDNAHHFADITGSGRVDYICMAPSGQAWAWLRGEDGVAIPSGQIKYTESLDRANFVFADVNGDGKADLLHKDKFNGDTQVWYNQEQVSEEDRDDNAGSIIRWERPQRLFRGVVKGPDTHYPSLGGQGRADMVYAKVRSAHAHISFNLCPRGGDDDASDTNLPEYTPPTLSTNPEQNWFCKGNGNDWTPDLWLQRGVGTWLRQRVDVYSAAENSWPRDDRNPVNGVPSIIAAYDGFNRDNAFNFHPSCWSLLGTCVLQDRPNTAVNCPKNQERAFSVWAMGNYATFFQLWWRTIVAGIDSAATDAATFTATFLPVKAEDSSANSAAWLTIVAGLFTSVGAITPGVAGAGTNVAAGIFTAGAGVASFASSSAPGTPPEFSTFADLSSSLNSVKTWTNNTMRARYNRLFRETPPSSDRDRGSELAKALESGVWANQSLTDPDSANIWDSARVANIIKTAMISEIWSSNEVAIFSWSKDHALAKWGFSPCFGTSNFGIGDHVACENGRNYLIARQIMRRNQPEAQNWPSVGSTKATLGNYSLDHLKIINAAQRNQDRAQAFIPRGFGHIPQVLEDAAQRPNENHDEMMTVINTPVCDLDKISPFDLYANLDNNAATSSCIEAGKTSPIVLKSCVAHTLAQNCRKLVLPGGPWPYQYTILGGG